MPFTAPRTSFNASVSGRRSVAFVDVSLEEVKAVKQAVGATVNDVLTALVSRALRRYLTELGELPDRPLIAVEPVSVHGQAGAQHGTTQVSVMFTTLATHVADPLERLRSSVRPTPRPRSSTSSSAPTRCCSGPSTSGSTSSRWELTSTPVSTELTTIPSCTI